MVCNRVSSVLSLVGNKNPTKGPSGTQDTNGHKPLKKSTYRALKASLEEIQITIIHHFLPAFRPKEMVKGMLVTWISSFLLPLPKTKIV